MSIKYSVGIVTFDKRFSNYFKPLLEQIKTFKPEIEVLVCVNGNYNKLFSQQYRKDMLNFLVGFYNVYPFFWTEFRSLSKLWNNCILNATNDHVLVLNDDISIVGEQFWNELEQNIELFQGETFKINSSWSHFFANRKEIDKLGWFDERLLGVGQEDGDMQMRIEKYLRNPHHNVSIAGAINHVDYNEPLEGMKKVSNKYNAYNLEHFMSKWDFSALTEEEKKDGWSYREKITLKEPTLSACPFEEYYWNNKCKLEE